MVPSRQRCPAPTRPALTNSTVHNQIIQCVWNVGPSPSLLTPVDGLHTAAATFGSFEYTWEPNTVFQCYYVKVHVKAMRLKCHVDDHVVTRSLACKLRAVSHVASTRQTFEEDPEGPRVRRSTRTLISFS
jgi:hypothetical protein